MPRSRRPRAQPHRADEHRSAGDVFAVVYIAKENKLYVLNASGTAPTGATVQRLKKLGYTWDPAIGVRFGHARRRNSVGDRSGGGVGLGRTAANFGTLTFKETRSLRSTTLSRLPDFGTRRQRLGAAEALAGNDERRTNAARSSIPIRCEWFIDGTPAGAGQMHESRSRKNFRLLQQQGRDGFYKGEIAQAIVAKSTASAAR